MPCAAARFDSANEDRTAALAATRSSMRNAGAPEPEGCNRRPPCSWTMRQQAFNESDKEFVLPSELKTLGNDIACGDESSEGTE